MTTTREPLSGTDVAAGFIAGSIVILGVVLFVGLMVLYQAAVLCALWGWFLAPLGLPQIGVAWAIGICAVAALLSPTTQNGPREQNKHAMLIVFAKPMIALLIGFVAKQFM